MAYGVKGALDNLGDGNPTKLAIWVVSIDLIHDLVLAPAVVIVGLVLAALLPPVAQGPVRTASALSGLVILFSVPLITAWGRRAGNSSTLPRNYAHSVIAALLAIWAVTAVVLAWRMLRPPPAGHREGPGS